MSAEQVLVDTLALLEWRLQRLEYLVLPPLAVGHTHEGASKSGSVSPDMPTRVQRLELAIRQLGVQSDTAKQLLRLDAQNPSLFTTIQSESASSRDLSEPEPSTPQKLSILTSEAPQITTTASQLRHLSDMPLPQSSTFTKLVTLQPRIEAAAARQAEQAVTISGLRKRSAQLVGRWHEGMVLGQGKCWADWEGRVRGVEVGVRRAEFRREDEK